jgi:DNA-binding MarR family transcriptional regulator
MSIMLYDEPMTQDPDPLGLQASSGYLLALVGSQSRRLWARMLGEHGLTPAHFGVLMMLDRLGALSQQNVSRSVGLDPRNAVPVIDALQQRGLVERRPDPSDRRRHAVTITPAGAELLDRLRRDGDELERDMLACLDVHEQTTLHRLLLKLHAGFGSPS